MKKICLFLIRLYKIMISPFLGPCCRFFPSCSDYGCEAIEKYGIGKGSWLLFKRIFKCGPWHPGGYDPP